MAITRGRVARAALAGCGAAVAYLAGAELASKRISGRGLLTVALAGYAVMASAKSRNLEQRFDAFLDTGGTIGGDLHVTGRVFADDGATMGNNLYMAGFNINNLGIMNNDGSTWASGGGLSMGAQMWLNNHDIWMGGGTVHP